jgi:hypothetical protein
MYFKFSNNNPFRDFVRYAHRIATQNVSKEEQLQLYRDLWRIAAPRLSETERLLNASPAFAQRCVHWNQRDITSIKPMRNESNPWLRFKREFELSLSQEIDCVTIKIQTALAWFERCEHRDDWIVG